MNRAALKGDINGSFNFWVEIDGLLVGGFTEVLGLESEVEVEEYHEGGVNGYTHLFPKRIKYPPLLLKKGITNSSELWDWYEEVVAGKVKRKNGSIILQNQLGQEVCRWNFFECYPTKWIGPELDAASSEVAIEALEIVHNGFKTIFNKE